MIVDGVPEEVSLLARTLEQALAERQALLGRLRGEERDVALSAVGLRVVGLVERLEALMPPEGRPCPDLLVDEKPLDFRSSV